MPGGVWAIRRDCVRSATQHRHTLGASLQLLFCLLQGRMHCDDAPAALTGRHHALCCCTSTHALSFGANTPQGRTALSIACYFLDCRPKRSLCIIEMLLAAGADPLCADFHGVGSLVLRWAGRQGGREAGGRIQGRAAGRQLDMCGRQQSAGLQFRHIPVACVLLHSLVCCGLLWVLVAGSLQAGAPCTLLLCLLAVRGSWFAMLWLCFTSLTQLPWLLPKPPCSPHCPRPIQTFLLDHVLARFGGPPPTSQPEPPFLSLPAADAAQGPLQPLDLAPDKHSDVLLVRQDVLQAGSHLYRC